MKNMFSSAEVFTAYAAIDAGYYAIKELQQHISQPVKPIEAMIDQATGASRARNEGAKKCCIEILEGIIANKKIIEADYSIDEDYLNQLKKLEV